MVKHLRANLWLLLFSVVILCVLYPLVLWGIGQTIFPDKANGSLVLDKNGAPIGSLLTAMQPTRLAHTWSLCSPGNTTFRFMSRLLCRPSISPRLLAMTSLLNSAIPKK